MVYRAMESLSYFTITFFVALNVVQFVKYGCVNPYCFTASTIMYVRDE